MIREFFQQYSFVFFSLGIVIGLIVLLRLLRLPWRYTLLAASGLSLVLTGGLLILRPGLSDVDSVQAAEAMLGNGKPTFMEFFSNY